MQQDIGISVQISCCKYPKQVSSLYDAAWPEKTAKIAECLADLYCLYRFVHLCIKWKRLLSV